MSIFRDLSIWELREMFPQARVVAVTGGFQCDIVGPQGNVVASSGVWPTRKCSTYLPWTSGMLAAREAVLEAVQLVNKE